MQHRDKILKQLECLLCYARMSGANDSLMAVLENQARKVRDQVDRWAHDLERVSEARTQQPDWEVLWAEVSDQLEHTRKELAIANEQLAVLRN